VDGVDLTIAEGSFFAMLGPSGSGKTTCLRLISGFEKPTGGQIRIFGEDVSTPPATAQREHGVPGLCAVSALNVRDNVAYGLMVKGIGRRTRDSQGRRDAGAGEA
jgi:putative spermidine/putrescine transport system ATP-binding protein